MDLFAKPPYGSARQIGIVLLLILALLLTNVSEFARAVPSPASSSGPPGIVFRYDDRGPDEIFAQGFRAVGLNTNLINHLLGVGMRRADTDCTEPNQTGSAFISTTSREAVVRRMARGRLQLPQGMSGERHVWIYTIRADGRFFGALRSVQRAMDRMEDCDITPELQARLITLGSVLNVARSEGEWVAYRYIPPSLIHYAVQYRLSADSRDVEEIPGTRRDNARYELGTTHANEVPWLIDALARPSRSFAFRAYNQLNAAATTALERVRRGTFGAQFCTAGCLSPARSNRTEPGAPSRAERASQSPPPTDAQLYREIDVYEAKVLAQDLRDLALPKRCALPKLYDPPESSAPFHSNGSCEAPEPFQLDSLMPNGYVWVDGHLAETSVPWASWDTDEDQSRKNRPIYCRISLGTALRGVIRVTCQPNPYFTTYYVVLRSYSGPNRIDTQFIGNDVAGVSVDAWQIPLVDQPGKPGRSLAAVARGDPGREGRLIQEAFNSPYWNSSIIVAPAYVPQGEPHPPEWPGEGR